MTHTPFTPHDQSQNPYSQNPYAHTSIQPIHRGDTMNYNTGSFTRPTEGKMVAGVCQAIANHMKWDVNLVRAAAAIGTVITSGAPLIIYLALWAVIPETGAETTAFSEAIKKGQEFYNDQQAKKRRAPSAQPGPAPHTPMNQTPMATGSQADPDPFDLYKD